MFIIAPHNLLLFEYQVFTYATNYFDYEFEIYLKKKEKKKDHLI